MKATTVRKRARRSHIERHNPELTRLAAAIGGQIYQRVGEAWLAPWDRQLTARQLVHEDGRVEDLDLAGKAAVAEKALRRIAAAREQPGWGTRLERAMRLIDGLERETIPAFLPDHFCYWRHESTDQACVSRFMGVHASIELVGEERIEIDGARDFEAAIARAREAAKERFGAES